MKASLQAKRQDRKTRSDRCKEYVHRLLPRGRRFVLIEGCDVGLGGKDTIKRVCICLWLVYVWYVFNNYCVLYSVL